MPTTTQRIRLQHYMGHSQQIALRHACAGEEGPYFDALLLALADRIAHMPTIYQTDGQGDAALCQLHYFNASSDWYIIERDTSPEQHQAFGFACLNRDTDNAELGYIPISELIALGVELDLYFTPTPLADIKKKLGC